MNKPEQLFTDTYLKITHLFHDAQVKEEEKPVVKTMGGEIKKGGD